MTHIIKNDVSITGDLDMTGDLNVSSSVNHIRYDNNTAYILTGTHLLSFPDADIAEGTGFTVGGSGSTFQNTSGITKYYNISFSTPISWTAIPSGAAYIEIGFVVNGTTIDNTTRNVSGNIFTNFNWITGSVGTSNPARALLASIIRLEDDDILRIYARNASITTTTIGNTTASRKDLYIHLFINEMNGS